jgi:hypothetical protein
VPLYRACSSNRALGARFLALSKVEPFVVTTEPSKRADRVLIRGVGRGVVVTTMRGFLPKRNPNCN